MSASGSPGLSGLLSSTTRLSQALSAVLVSGYLAQLIPGVRSHLALVAGRTIPRIWNIVTAGLLEEHLYTLVPSVLAVLVLSKVIEPVYGSRAYLKFLAIVLCCSGLTAFVSVYVAYALDRNESSNLLFGEICGFHGVVAGLLVAVKHIAPDTELTLLQFAKLRAKHVVSLYVMAAAVVSMVLGRVIATMPFVFGGAYSAWFYLRFLQSNASNPAEQGDSSADFSFASFYPSPVQPVMDRMAGVCASIFRLDRPATDGSAAGAAAAQAPAAKSAEASRRRERGQRALEERLGLKSTVQVGREAAAPTVTAPPADVETGGGNGGATSEIQAAPES